MSSRLGCTLSSIIAACGIILQSQNAFCESIDLGYLLKPFENIANNSGVELKCYFWEKAWRADGEYLTEINYTSVIAINTPSKLRIECKPYRGSVVGQPGEYANKFLTLISDGSKWITLYNAADSEDKRVPLNEAEITKDKPSVMGDAAEGQIVGQSFFPTMLPILNGISLREMLSSNLSNSPTKYRLTENEGVQKIVFENPCSRVTVNIQKNAALLLKCKYEYNLCNPNGKLTPITIDYTFSDPITIADTQIKIPSKILRNFYKGETLSNTEVIRIEEAKIITDLSEDTFKASLPPGWTVFDRIHNVSFVTGQQPSQVIESMRGIINAK